MKREYQRPDDWDSFILYKSQFAPISDLSNDALGRLFRHLFRWQMEGEANPESDVAMAFKFMVNQFRIDDEKRMTKCAINQENGKLGGRPPKTERLLNNRTVTNKPNGGHNENENVNENENGNVEVEAKPAVDDQVLNIPFQDPDFLSVWNKLREQPKWRNKTTTALQMSLDQLSKYKVQFAIYLMECAIAGNHQGVVFSDTPSRYKRWLEVTPLAEQGQDTTSRPVRIVRDGNDIY